MKTTLRNAGIGLVCLASLAASPGAFAGVSKVICVPWQGDPLKYHTVIGDTCATKSAPQTITLEVLDTPCNGPGGWALSLNGASLGTTSMDTDCTCSAPVNTLVINNATLSGAWNNAGGNLLRATKVGTVTYLAIIRATIDYGGGDIQTVCMFNSGGGDCNPNQDLCAAGYEGPPAFVEVDLTCSGGVANYVKGVIKTTDNGQIWYKWVFGDGSESAIQSLSGQTRYTVESVHTYTGAAGTPFTAQLVVADNDALSSPTIDNYLLKLENNTLDARINVAIDNGLWYLYKQGQWSTGGSGNYRTKDGTPCTVWPGNGNANNYFASPTAGALQAFQINGHKQTGDFDQDPYAEVVQRGLKWLLMGYYSSESYYMLQSLSIGLQHGGDNPDANGNGIGIQVRDYSLNPAYQGGQIMDAIIASGTPGMSSGRDFGSGHAHTYAEIIQDMCDMYGWGQNDGSGVGSWRYSWNYGAGQDDNSAAQWAAIGMIPAQVAPWSAVVPQWVKNYDNAALDNSFYTSGSGGIWGHFGYVGTSPLGCPGYPCPASGATTPSGMVQLSFADKTTADTRWSKSERWMAENWDTGDNWFGGAKANLYAMYAMTKAMRLAKPSPVVNFAINGFDWYRGNASHEGVAKALSDKLVEKSYYDQTFWEGTTLATEWAVIMLKPSLFAASPIACFTAHPNPSFSDQPISFDPSCSGHSDPAKSIANLVKFEWDWDNNGTFDQTTATPTVVTHSFHCASVPCAFPVVLKVTDDAGLTATFSLTINITDPPHPPISKPGGPYLVSLCAGDALKLDGSASFDPDEGLHQAGCNTCPNDTITAWNWDLDGAPFTYAGPSGNTVDLGSGFTTYFPSAGSYDIGLKVTDNTLLAYPASGKPNLTDEAFARVLVYRAGFCDLTGTPGCQEVALNWANFGAQTYYVYQSYTGPNSGFVEVANTSGTTATVGANQGQDAWYRVLAVKNGESYLTLALKLQASAGGCQCISNLKSSPKAGKVQLDWTPYAGAACYDIYRSTVSPVALVAANRIKTCYVNPYVTYLDTAVVNGTTYYYKVVVKSSAGADVCTSAEVSAKPVLPRR